MTAKRNALLIVSGAAIAATVGVVLTNGAETEVVPTQVQPAQRPTAPAERGEGVWERAAREQAEFEAAAQTRAERDALIERPTEEVPEETAAIDPTASEPAATETTTDADPFTQKLFDARMSANESAAIATLRSIAAAQAMCQAAVLIDTNADGAGEYGYLAELAGAAPLRELGPTSPVVGNRKMNPAMLASAFGVVRADSAGHGTVERSGYFYKVFLPDAQANGVAESITGGATGVASSIDAELAKARWCAYAWPVENGRTGRRIFFINERGDLLERGTDAGAPGSSSVPRFSDAYTTSSMDAPIAWNAVR
ncbi:MAG: hypothetical protein GY711_34955 [bacterium]|nr:hypothetical protein [bacterium]